MTVEDLPKEVMDTLQKLRNNGLKLAIGSSSKNTLLILKQIGLENFFDAISDGTMITYSKPHPEVFMKAADLLNVNYKHCLVVEDAVAGCIAAKSASMKVAAIASAYGNNVADFHLNCFNNQITGLDLSGCINLDFLDCNNNRIERLDVSGCKWLEKLRCANNRLVLLNITKCSNLAELDCYNNQLVNLDFSDCNHIKRIICIQIK